LGYCWLLWQYKHGKVILGRLSANLYKYELKSSKTPIFKICSQNEKNHSGHESQMILKPETNKHLPKKTQKLQPSHRFYNNIL
jgi:hypothetical protein